MLNRKFILIAAYIDFDPPNNVSLATQLITLKRLTMLASPMLLRRVNRAQFLQLQLLARARHHKERVRVTPAHST